MMRQAKYYILMLASLFIFSVSAFSQSTISVVDADLGSGTYNWTNNNVYLLDGFVYLEAGGVLNIQEGTVIKAKANPSTGDNASALIITVGAKINAIGTATQPIIFTSELDDLSDPSDLTSADRGLWGGLILLGDGILGNSTPTSSVEGIPTTESRAQFGGTNNANNAGTIKYISIRHGGAALSPGNEINGLTLAGVGSGTTIDYVEVIANLDDGVEFFGGAVNIKHAAMAFCGDDGFDWDLGWVGKGQYWFVLEGSDIADNGGEWDGAIPDGMAVYSNPTVYNATFIGSGTGSVSAINTNGIIMRDATAGTFANSIITDYAHKAMEIEDLPAASGIDSYTRMQNGELNLLNNIWYGFAAYTTFDANPTTGIIRFTAGGDDTTCADLINHLTSHNNLLTDPTLNGISRIPNGQLDPRPAKSNTAITSGLASYPADVFFTPSSYKGAFDPTANSTWLKGWTALDEYGFLSSATAVNPIAKGLNNSIDIYPNPANDIINLSINTLNKQSVNIAIYDILGHAETMPSVYSLNKGSQVITLNIDFLNPGVYMLKISSESGAYSKQFIVQ